MNKRILAPIIFLIVAVALITTIAFLDKTSTSTSSGGTYNQPVSTSTNPTTPAPVAKSPSGYTMAEVSKHNSQSSCWTAINGNVYDVTSWISQHPGGPEAILSLCGTDGSDAFNGQHGGQTRPEQELATFKIGALVN